ncbi:hypothetical protein NPIL_231851, partial [Nephila pilipes]
MTRFEKSGSKPFVGKISPLQINLRLQKFAVPTIFPNCSKYISKSSNPVRECPEQRRQRNENEHIQRSIQE